MWGEDLALSLGQLIALGGKISSHRASAMIIRAEEYDQLQTQLLEVRFYLNSLSMTGISTFSSTIIQECDIRNFQPNTKFLAKTYFDIALSRLPSLNAQKVRLYLLTALRIAVKFNENVHISQSYTIEWLVELTDGHFKHEDFIQAEIDMLNVLGYRLHLATPYDYVPIFRTLVKKFGKEKIREKKLMTLIDLALSMPQLMLSSQEQLFFACFGIVYGQLLEENDVRQLRSLIKDWTGIRQTEQKLRRLFSLMTGSSI